MKKIIFIFIAVFLFANNCNNRLFSLHIGSDGIPLKSVLSDIANQCNLTVVVNDDVARKKLNSNVSLVNINKETLRDFLNDLLSAKECFFDLKGNKLIISYYKSRIFKLDIVSSSRSGSSSLSGSGGSSSDTTSSNFSGSTSLNDSYQFDIWGVIEQKINRILKNNAEKGESVLKPVIDKNSGLIIVRGNKTQLEAVSNYMHDLTKRLMRQVYIDVKIYSVTLSKSHQTGINWQQLQATLNGSGKLRASNLFGKASVFNNATFNMNALLNVLATYGNVNSISNPQIVTLNNQKAVIQVGSNVYYKNVSQITKDQNGNVFTQYTVASQFVGFSLDIIPRIADNNEIMLYVYPTISKFAQPLSSVSNRDLPPDIKTNTIVSMVRLKNNQTLVLGGLITSEKTMQANGIPVLKEIPVIKYLFSYKEQISDKNEIVFIITPHIINLNKKVTLKDYGFKKLPSLEDVFNAK